MSSGFTSPDRDLTSAECRDLAVSLLLCFRHHLQLAMDPTLEITLNPRPGFCVKSAALEPGVYNGKIPVPAGLKTFVNVAYDDDAPPPAPGALETAQAAMLSQGPLPSDDDVAPFLPVLVSEGRSVTDKGA